MEENFDQTPHWEGFIKLILNRLDIPTKEDISLLHDRLDKLEQLLYQKQPITRKQNKKEAVKRKNASSIVLEVVANHPDGTNFKTIKAATGFDDKKIRNIIFRLDKIKKIKRVKRGIYKII
ncbi:MAG: phasin family protein [Desulfobacula sp.]|nr:phasin family protein [Desulfobacula sp.]